MREITSTHAAIGKAHVVGVGNVSAYGPMRVIRSDDGRAMIAVDGGLDAVVIELTAQAVGELSQILAEAV